MQSMEMFKTNSHLGIPLVFIILTSSHIIHTFGQVVPQVVPQSDTTNAGFPPIQDQKGFPPVQPLNTHSNSYGSGSTGIPEFPGPIDPATPAVTSTGQPISTQIQGGFQQGGFQQGYQTPPQQQTGYPQQNSNQQSSISSSGFNQMPFAKITNQGNQPGIANNNLPFFNSANSGEVSTLIHFLPPLIIATMAFLF